MFKITGAVLVMISAIAWSAENVLRLRDREISLKALEQSLEIMRSEICDRLTPLPELFELLAKTSSNPAGIFYNNLSNAICKLENMPFAEIWKETVRNTPELMLNLREVTEFEKLGYSIGRYDAEEQRRAIDRAYENMREFAKTAQMERARDSKAKAFVGIAAGIFAVIILI